MMPALKNWLFIPSTKYMGAAVVAAVFAIGAFLLLMYYLSKTPEVAPVPAPLPLPDKLTYMGCYSKNDLQKLPNTYSVWSTNRDICHKIAKATKSNIFGSISNPQMTNEAGKPIQICVLGTDKINLDAVTKAESCKLLTTPLFNIPADKTYEGDASGMPFYSIN